MENKKFLLDCTLRDGGYVNDWNFGREAIAEIFSRLVSSNVDAIEVGFLDERRSFDVNRTIMPDTKALNRVFSGMNKGRSLVFAMIDYGTCGLENIQPCNETFLDGIRVIFKENLMYEALEFCRQLKNLGYKIFAQMVSVTTYSDKKLSEYADLVNAVQPFGTSMVDTYGLMHQKQLLHIVSELDRKLKRDIILGFHGHNNFQMAYANCIELLNSDINRSVLVDGTLYGMGKSAGNAPSELLAMYLNENCNGKYDINQMSEAIDNSVMEIYQKQYWGYSLHFYIAAANKCHPNYVAFLMGKKTLSVKQINEILSVIPCDKKLMYDPKYTETLYLNYQNVNCDDKAAINKLTKFFKNKKILLLGPGNSIKRQSKKIRKFIEENKPVVISVNYLPSGLPADYVFLTNAKRYVQLLADLNSHGEKRKINIIATSNVAKTEGRFKYVLNYGSLIDAEAEIIDNSLVMLLKTMIETDVKEVVLAGFDGYSKRNDNYFNVSREYVFAKTKAEYLNKYVADFLRSIDKKLRVAFLTYSRYTKIMQSD